MCGCMNVKNVNVNVNVNVKCGEFFLLFAFYDPHFFWSSGTSERHVVAST